MDSFWDYFWLVFACFAFAAYLMVLFMIFADLFRDHRMSGWMKALWVFLLFVLPVIAACVYLIVRGPAMAERAAVAERQYLQAETEYIRDVAGTSTDEQLATARSLLDSGAITEDEYRVLAARAQGASAS
ncbi:SHOCT domain-containing protein [Rhodococcus sp. AG1013]|jgi:predicted PurR-regulated permease PerM|uniref:SHOCT domain-containing protein n=1 Tax=unclassified Rhodococcus (in: high G+C Gram-positive bacteria) TaxID=192944 RepID=UPI000E0CB190|nr:SHOCT domain-containing protein [Rhodococcus sp. AG1013]RDI25776.1 phospholipase D-like protein [Rhodococcus sp. AG1013]